MAHEVEQALRNAAAARTRLFKMWLADVEADLGFSLADFEVEDFAADPRAAFEAGFEPAIYADEIRACLA